MHKSRYLIVMAMVAVGLSAQVSPAVSDLPSNQQVIGFLTESIDWYHHCVIERQLATNPVDLVFLEENRAGAAQILQLSFDFARADAQFSAKSQSDTPNSSDAVASGSPDLTHLVQLENSTELQRREASEEIEVITNKLTNARGAEIGELQAALDTAQSRLDVLQAGLATLQQSIAFLRAFSNREAGDLAATIDDLARTVPDLATPSPSQTQNPASYVLPKSADSGILALSSQVSTLGRKLSILDDEIRRTDHLRQSTDVLRDPLLASINKGLPALAQNALQARDLAELRQQKNRLDELAALLKALSPAVIALDKQRVLLAAYTSHLKSWRAAVIAEDKKLWKNLISRLVGAAAVIGALVILGAVVRRVTRRYMRDADRRHIALVIQRVVLWATIVAVCAFAFASDLTSLATFFGLLAAGVAVALQSVILSAIGYFVLVGRRGMRIGDRVQISGVTGDVTDIGWLQFQLKEIDSRTQQPTGNVVTFSNSFVLASPATGLSRFQRKDSNLAELKVATTASRS